jgi:uncharacterized membrane protein YfcA
MRTIILFLSAFIASIISGISGFGVALLLLPVLSSITVLSLQMQFLLFVRTFEIS